MKNLCFVVVNPHIITFTSLIYRMLAKAFNEKNYFIFHSLVCNLFKRKPLYLLDNKIDEYMDSYERNLIFFLFSFWFRISLYGFQFLNTYIYKKPERYGRYLCRLFKQNITTRAYRPSIYLRCINITFGNIYAHVPCSCIYSYNILLTVPMLRVG